jgi:hypothetical protein
MSEHNAAALATQIDDYLNQLTAVQRAADAGNVGAQALQVELSATIASLITVYRIKATEEINDFITPGFEHFDGTSLVYPQLKDIYIAVLGADGESGCKEFAADTNALLSCLVTLAPLNSQLNRAVKERIVDEVQNLISTYNNPNDPEITAILEDTGVMAQQFLNGIPFKYNRQGAASYAIGEAIDNFENFFPAGYGDDLTETVHGTVGGDFNNYYLLHSSELDSTGSAFFISEALYSGGKIPMESSIDPALPCETGYADVSTGRRVCCESDDGATYSWKAHQGIINYFAFRPEDDRSIPLRAISPNLQSHEIEALKFDTIFYAHTSNFQNLLQTTGVIYPSLQGIDLNSDGTWTSNDINNGDGPSYLYNLFSVGAMSDIKTGDYIYIYQGGYGAHGFIIVGWGLAQPIGSGINAQVGVDFHIEKQNTGFEIPYVVDFAYGYNGDDTGFLQDIRPRPFYLSSSEFASGNVPQKALIKRSDIPNSFTVEAYLTKIRGGYSAFTYSDDPNVISTSRPTWRFLRIPDIVWISFERLYIPPCEV